MGVRGIEMNVLEVKENLKDKFQTMQVYQQTSREHNLSSSQYSHGQPSGSQVRESSSGANNNQRGEQQIQMSSNVRGTSSSGWEFGHNPPNDSVFRETSQSSQSQHRVAQSGQQQSQQPPMSPPNKSQSNSINQSGYSSNRMSGEI